MKWEITELLPAEKVSFTTCTYHYKQVQVSHDSERESHIVCPS